MNDAVGSSLLGLNFRPAAAALGDIKNGGDAQIISDFAQYARKEWAASGIRKGYMYMLDIATDPRWQRTYGTFGESTELIVTAKDSYWVSKVKNCENSVALTMKHFPRGARENGFDPHYKEGKFNVYKTSSLEKYHLPPFKVAVDYKASSIIRAIQFLQKSAVQEYNGEKFSEDVGFAFNKYFIDDILRKRWALKAILIAIPVLLTIWIGALKI